MTSANNANLWLDHFSNPVVRQAIQRQQTQTTFDALDKWLRMPQTPLHLIILALYWAWFHYKLNSPLAARVERALVQNQRQQLLFYFVRMCTAAYLSVVFLSTSKDDKLAWQQAFGASTLQILWQLFNLWGHYYFELNGRERMLTLDFATAVRNFVPLLYTSYASSLKLATPLSPFELQVVHTTLESAQNLFGSDRALYAALCNLKPLVHTTQNIVYALDALRLYSNYEATMSNFSTLLPLMTLLGLQFGTDWYQHAWPVLDQWIEHAIAIAPANRTALNSFVEHSMSTMLHPHVNEHLHEHDVHFVEATKSD